ncbi:MAG: polyprenyl glycosylphosphotransferase [Methylibium sp. NZG]|nr:MAG: polyprenyl glycosylphosphotransferase [Methylibium sp. NZG]
MFMVFRHHVSVAAFTAMMADMVLCFVAIVLAAGTLEGARSAYPLQLYQVVLTGAQFALIISLMYSFAGLYRPTPIALPAKLLRTVIALVVGSYLTYLMLLIVAEPEYVKLLIGSALLYCLVGVVFVRSGLYFLRRVSTQRRVLIVGTGAEAYAVAGDLKALKRASNDVVGFYPTSEAAQGQVQDDIPLAIRESQLSSLDGPVPTPKVFSREATIGELVERHRIDEIIVAEREQRGGGVPMDQLLACRIRGIPVLDLAAFYERAKSEVPIDSLKASWLVYGHGFVQGRARQIAKRAFDILCSGFLLTLASPIMLLTILAIKLDSPGPIIYRQERVGLGGRIFMCLKFRSMRTDAEKDGVARWATKNDARVTRIGAFIRKTRIDELPQLLSVLKGEMSLVGPRPERPSFVAQLREQIPFYDVRHSVKPGVTGWAQVRYSYGASLEDARRKHQFDLYYVKNNSLFLDLLVLIETVSVVLFREGQ